MRSGWAALAGNSLLGPARVWNKGSPEVIFFFMKKHAKLMEECYDLVQVILLLYVVILLLGCYLVAISF